MILNLEPHDLERIADAVVGRLGDGYRRTQWLTSKEAADHLRCSTRHLQKLVHLGEVKSYRPAGRPLFKADELDAYVHQTEEV